MLVWEWEDKFAYPSNPEIGAPGAFTMKEMQEFTSYAKQYHIQIVPLVQGLGHVSFILNMSFLICDDQLLDMEEYLEKLEVYIEYFTGLVKN